VILRYALLWLGLPVIGIINGAIREIVYKEALGELFAHQLSSFTAVVFIGLYAWTAETRWRLSSSYQAAVIGCIWLLLTIAFEFLFGHYVMGHSWASLFNDYNVLEGRFWSIVVFWTAIAPLVILRMKE
jgi:hypothetical protein